VIDLRIVYGARCVWWDSITKAATTPSGLPCCPHCGGVLFETASEEAWWEAVDKHEAQGALGYHKFVEWSRGKCFPTYGDARVVYDRESA
jgi:hypothetical protein